MFGGTFPDREIWIYANQNWVLQDHTPAFFGKPPSYTHKYFDSLTASKFHILLMDMNFIYSILILNIN